MHHDAMHIQMTMKTITLLSFESKIGKKPSNQAGSAFAIAECGKKIYIVYIIF